MAALAEEEEDEEDSDRGGSDGAADKAGDGSGDGTDGKSGNGSGIGGADEAALKADKGEDGKDGLEIDENQGDVADDKKKRRLRTGPLVPESVKGKMAACCSKHSKSELFCHIAMLLLLQTKVSSLSPGCPMLLQMLASRRRCVAN